MWLISLSTPLAPTVLIGGLPRFLAKMVLPLPQPRFGTPKTLALDSEMLALGVQKPGEGTLGNQGSGKGGGQQGAGQPRVFPARFLARRGLPLVLLWHLSQKGASLILHFVGCGAFGV